MRKILGQTDLNVSPIALGGNVFGWTIQEREAFKIIDYYVESDFNLIDTADVYSTWKQGNGGGESETIIGNWIKRTNKRQSIIIATKVGARMNENREGLSYKYILEAAEDSLKRLKTDYIDLYQSHYDDINIPIDETLEAYYRLIKDGKVRWIGASNFSNERLLLSIKIAKENNLPVYQSLQPEYNLYNRKLYEQEYEEICNKYHLGVITYFSLAAGFLTGKYQNAYDLENNQRGARVKRYFNNRGFNILTTLKAVSFRNQVKPATIAIAWLLSKPTVTAAITSATTIIQLQDILLASELKLSTEDIDELNAASNY